MSTVEKKRKKPLVIRRQYYNRIFLRAPKRQRVFIMEQSNATNIRDVEFNSPPLTDIIFAAVVRKIFIYGTTANLTEIV